MKREKQTNKTACKTKLVFNIKKIKNTINLNGSFSIIDGECSRTLFESEIFKVTFSAQKQDNIHSVDLYLSSNEMICDSETVALKEQLGIEIFGDGSFFEIIDYQTSFTIQFDQENSLFIESDEVKNGLLFFKK